MVVQSVDFIYNNGLVCVVVLLNEMANWVNLWGDQKEIGKMPSDHFFYQNIVNSK